MNEEEIEAAAKAAYESEYDTGDPPWERLSTWEQLSYRHIAEAALAAAARVRATIETDASVKRARFEEVEEAPSPPISPRSSS